VRRTPQLSAGPARRSSESGRRAATEALYKEDQDIMVGSSLLFAEISLAGMLFVTASAWSQSKDSHGAQPVKEMKFEILSIRPTQPGPAGGNWGYTPGGFVWKARIWDALELAFVSEDASQWNFTFIANTPNWTREETYDFNARVAQADIKAWQSQKHYELLRSSLRNALKERCKLAIHEEPLEGENWELMVGKRGAKLKPATTRDNPPNGVKTLDGGFMTPFGLRSTSWHFYGATMGDLARFLSTAGRPVRDKTGLTGRYDFPLEQIPDPMPPSPDMVFKWPVDPLGLRLKPGKEMRSKFVIDHIEKPSAN
jgi:uncharacterized protein (TIGR03435 family)